MASSDIALIFINWNSGRLLLAAVASLAALPPAGRRYRLIVVDNGSADDSLRLCEEQLRPGVAARPELFAGLEVLAMSRNLGFAAAVNRGLAAVHEPFALILNTDIEFQNQAPVLLVQALAQDPEAVLAAPRLLRPDGSEQAAALPLPTLASELGNRSLSQRLFRRRMGARLAATCRVPSIVGPCMAVHMERLRRVGFLDERFFFFFEETDWCRRIGAAGLAILFVPEARVMHLQGESANTRPYRARIQFNLARYQYFAKHRGPAVVGVLALGLFLRLTLSLLATLLLTVFSLGRRRFRDRFLVQGCIWLWHLLLCRPGWGFAPPRQDGGEPRG